MDSEPSQATSGSQSESDEETEASPSDVSEAELWQSFIGPSKSIQFSVKDGWSWRPAYLYYQEKFRQFHTPSGPRFAFSWNWPAALLDSFLWFLYRKMYMFAFVYLIGPYLSILAFGDLSMALVWKIGAGVSANYLYYWHIKDSVERVRKQPGLDGTTQLRIMKEEGGVQPYVIALGVALAIANIAVAIWWSDQLQSSVDQTLPSEPAGEKKYF